MAEAEKATAVAAAAAVSATAAATIIPTTMTRFGPNVDPTSLM